VINWMLELEDVEDDACPVDDMKGHGLFANFRFKGVERRRVNKV
jgi:hypothetical protein